MYLYFLCFMCFNFLLQFELIKMLFQVKRRYAVQINFQESIKKVSNFKTHRKTQNNMGKNKSSSPPPQQQQNNKKSKKLQVSSDEEQTDKMIISRRRMDNKNNKKFSDRFYDQDEIAVPDTLPEGMEPEDLLNELSIVTKLFTALYLGAIMWGLILAYRGELIK